ncbi:MAG TPA: magnesium transporter [Polyangia bacterium]|nr:magnesium transporter [Polyangia bacterium]
MNAVAQADPKDALSADELIDAWPVLSKIDRAEGFAILPRPEAEEVFLGLGAADQLLLMESLPAGEKRSWARLLPPDDAADLMQMASPAQREALLELLDEPTRKEVKALLAYKEDEAGGLMNPRYARVRPDMTVDEAVSYLRQQARAKVETIYVAYVLDDQRVLVGVVSFRDLFSAQQSLRVRDIMRTEFVTVTEQQDQESVSRLFAQHDLVAIPVVDAEGRMKGIVTVDDIVDVVQEEATEDAQKFGGMEALDAPYLQIGLLRMIKKRAGWLAVLFLGEMLTATAMAFFEGEIARAVVLAMFIPLIISSGGNSGSQASTLVIRAMALGEVRLRDWWRVIRREVVSGLALGLVLGSIGFLRIVIWNAVGGRVNHKPPYGEHGFLVAVTVFFSLLGVVLFGSLSGSLLPFLLKKLKFDPASASAPFVATLVDVTGLIIYFTAASLILKGTLL